MLKMTKQRQLLLEFMKQQKSPLSAEMIYANIPSGSMNLSTVYRTLDAFKAHNLVEKTFLDNVAYYKIASKNHKHYMVCLDCHKMYEMDCHFHGLAEEDAKKHHFTVTNHDLTIYGYCQTCMASHSIQMPL
ncbi:MAG: transcriptional repressor [Acholeplasma sp.]|nr:transcriptional repressor [Acholeplasma sp.]